MRNRKESKVEKRPWKSEKITVKFSLKNINHLNSIFNVELRCKDVISVWTGCIWLGEFMGESSISIGGRFNRGANANLVIRIPYAFKHKLWIVLIVLFAVGVTVAAWIVDPVFLFGIFPLLVGMAIIERLIGKSPGKIEFVSEHSYLVISRIDYSDYSGDNWQRTVLPTRFKFRVEDTGFRWSGERLEIITPKGAILLGSGKKMLPIRDWLVRHGLQPK